eukprot:TRINITY_DN4602_c1_g1_i1.p1 TRINITY_DN4602_c1_g1~~TRINITY_DN4602_c1_g1_i1.p1  ORF type:complete len:231 (-),score=25.12 TRINITY_DN4602_c1_g1_i1:750-1442(-)
MVSLVKIQSSNSYMIGQQEKLRDFEFRLVCWWGCITGTIILLCYAETGLFSDSSSLGKVTAVGGDSRRELLQNDSISSSFVFPFIIWVTLVITMWCCCKLRRVNLQQQQAHVPLQDGNDTPGMIVLRIPDNQDAVEIVTETYRAQGQHLERQLDTYLFHEKQAHPDYSACPICLEKYQEKDEIMILPCFHQFHKECIEPWMEEKGHDSVCPVCKQNVKDLLRASQQPQLD